MKQPAEMTDAELQAQRELIDDEVQSLNEVLRRLNDEIWLRQFNRDVAKLPDVGDATGGQS